MQLNTRRRDDAEGLCILRRSAGQAERYLSHAFVLFPDQGLRQIREPRGGVRLQIDQCTRGEPAVFSQ